MIEARDLTVVFRAGTPLENQALRDVSCRIPAGQFVTIIGSNGAGKSTFLNAIAGDVPISSGMIRIGGHDVAGGTATKRAALVSRVFQDPVAGTCEDLAIEENLAVALRRAGRRGWRRALGPVTRDRFRIALARLRLGLEERLHDPVGLLSGGQRQALSLLMATLADTKVLLLDEHTAALDPKAAALVLELTRTLVAERRITVLMVTHSMRQALDYGDRTLMFHQGKIIFDVEGNERRRLDVPDLLRMFEQAKGEQLADDRLVLG
jgi:putative tryptophan/tyrosine transport system ATP-binding protein